MEKFDKTAALIIEGSKGFNLTVEIDEMSPLYVLRTLFKQAGIRRVLVSDSANGKDIAKTSTKLGLDFVLNKRIKVESPEGCVLAGLSYLPERCERLYIVPADYPLFETETIIQLSEIDAEIAVPLYKGKRGYPVLVNRSLFAELQAHNGDLSAFLRANRNRATEIETGDMGVATRISKTSKHVKLASRHSLYSRLRPDDRIYVANRQSYFGPGLRQLIMLVDEQKSVNAARVIMGITAENISNFCVVQQGGFSEVISGRARLAFAFSRHSALALQKPHHSPQAKSPSPAKARAAAGFSTSSAHWYRDSLNTVWVETFSRRG